MTKLLTTLAAVLIATIAVNAADLSKHMPPQSPVLNGYNDMDSVKLAIDIMGPAGIEGLWQLAGNQAIVAIVPAEHPELSGAGFKALQIVIVSSPRKSMRPGTVLGYAVPTARPDTYDSYLYTSQSKSLLSKHKRFTLSLDDENHLIMTPAKSKWKFHLRHTFNFLVRAGISASSNSEQSNDGFIKLHPTPSGKPLNPVYL